MRVLIVDDDEMQREVAQELLTTLGYRVETAASGEEAVAWLRVHRADRQDACATLNSHAQTNSFMLLPMADKPSKLKIADREFTGRVTEIGTHEELITAGGRYASLVSRDTEQVLS